MDKRSRERRLTFLALFMGWGSYYLCRKSFSSTIPYMLEEGQFTKNQLGTIVSSFFLAYGISKLVSAVLSDRYSPRLLFVAGLLSSSVCTMAFPLCPSHSMCVGLWFIQGLVQGLGWPAAAKLLKVWYPPQYIGTWWSVLTCSGNIIAASCPLLFAYITMATRWDVGYYVSGSISMCVSILVLLLISEGPCVGDGHEKKSDVVVTSQKSNGLVTVMYYKDLWVISIIYLLLYIIKCSITDWGQLYFIEYAGITETTAAACIGLLQLGGMFGNIWGYLSDVMIMKMPQGMASPRVVSLLLSNLFFTIFLHILITIVHPGATKGMLGIMCFMAGFMLDGSVAVIGLSAMDSVPDHLSGSAHGIAAAFGQVGNVLAGSPFIRVVRYVGWNQGYQFLEVLSVGMVLLCAYNIARSINRHVQNKNV